MTWQQQIDQITHDKLSGAFALSAATAQALISLTAETPINSTDELLALMESIGETVLSSQTGMASLVGLYNRLFYAVAAQSDPEGAIQTLRETAKTYLAEQQRASTELSRRGVALMANGLTITT